MKKIIDKSKLFRRIIIALLLLLIIGFYFANREAKKYGYSGVMEVVSTYNTNSNLSSLVSPQKLKLIISESSLKFIEERRLVALDRGMQINDGENYVDCKIITDSIESNGEMRLKGHMTDHLEGDKWSFRVKSDEEVMGMYRFSLQHPGTRNYVYEWIYHELLKNEGVIFLKYDFINLSLNEKDLGIYAIEEHFGQHVLERNNRPKGAIVRWNPSLYWEWRIDEFQGNYLNEQYSSYSSSFAEPYDRGVVKKDEELIENYQTAVKQLELFRRGELKTSEVFDVELMAKFHAIIDLVGGHHSLDWSDVKFYYNSDTKLIEPVGYESFSVRKTESIAGQQIQEGYNKLQLNYHVQLFSDPIFFEAYIQNLERIADENYISDFKKIIQKELNEKIGLIAHEWAYRKFNFEGYFENIRLIRNNLELPKPIHAFYKSKTDSTITVSIAAVSDFPIEIIGLKKNDKTTELNNHVLIPAKARNTFTHYEDYVFKISTKKPKNILILAKIPGGKNVFEVELADYPYYKKSTDFKLDSLPINDFDTSVFEVKGSEIFLKNKATILSKNIIIPTESELILRPGQSLVLNAKLIVNGKISAHGFSETPVNFSSIEGGEIIVESGVFEASNSNFTGCKMIKSKNADVKLYRCLIFDVSDHFINDYQSEFSLVDCDAGSLNQFAVFNESFVTVKNCDFKKGNNFISSNGARIHIINSKISGYDSFANLDYSAEFKMWSTTASVIDTLFEVKNCAQIITYVCDFDKFNYGVVINKNDNNVKGESNYNFYRTELSEYKQLEINI
jgi:hypothetical protein